MKKIFIMAFALAATAIGTTIFAQGTKMAAGASMKSTIDIVDLQLVQKITPHLLRQLQQLV
jgi:hypothetical protein